MPLQLNFTITQDDDCDILTFTETTGSYASPDNEGGYGTPNPAHTDIVFTQLLATLPDTQVKTIRKGYTPSAAASPNGTFNIVPNDIDYTGFPNGVYNLELEAYSGNTTSGNLVNGTKYAVTGGSINYNNAIRAEDTVFTATSVDTFATQTGSPVVSPLLSAKDCNVLVYCHLRACLRKLMLDRRTEDCECKETLGDRVAELVIDFNAAVLAFNEQNYKCASDTIERLEGYCSGLCNDCGC